jgi:Leucine-rich repeat (LRR) protein
MIDSIKPEAVFLFANIKRINFYYYITNPGKLKNVITSIQLFEKANVERIDFISLKILTYAHSGSIDLCSFNELTNLKELILNTNKITFE